MSWLWKTCGGARLVTSAVRNLGRGKEQRSGPFDLDLAFAVFDFCLRSFTFLLLWLPDRKVYETQIEVKVWYGKEIEVINPSMCIFLLFHMAINLQERAVRVCTQ